MIFLLSFLKFLATTVAVFFSWILIMSIISSIINPQIIVENGNTIEKNNNARIWYAIIISLALALITILP